MVIVGVRAKELIEDRASEVGETSQPATAVPKSNPMEKKQGGKGVSTFQGSTLREENTGVNHASTSSILKIKHLQRLATWAGVEVGIPPLGALFGNRLATNAEAAGIPLDPSTSLCQRWNTRSRRKKGDGPNMINSSFHGGPKNCESRFPCGRPGRGLTGVLAYDERHVVTRCSRGAGVSARHPERRHQTQSRWSPRSHICFQCGSEAPVTPILSADTKGHELSMVSDLVLLVSLYGWIISPGPGDTHRHEWLSHSSSSAAPAGQNAASAKGDLGVEEMTGDIEMIQQLDSGGEEVNAAVNEALMAEGEGKQQWEKHRINAAVMAEANTVLTLPSASKASDGSRVGRFSKVYLRTRYTRYSPARPMSAHPLGASRIR